MWALLPIKTLAAAKQRLSHLLNASERQKLFTAMLHDVLAVLFRQSEVEGIILVSDARFKRGSAGGGVGARAARY